MDRRKDVAYVYPTMPSNQEMLAVLRVLNTFCGSKCISLNNSLLYLCSMDKQARHAVLFRKIRSEKGEDNEKEWQSNFIRQCDKGE